MTTDEALAFLVDHQPMPPDSVLTEESISRYNEVREHFLRNPDERCIPLFLGSFGEGDGLGVYQLVEDVLRCFPLEKVHSPLVAALASPTESVRCWATQIAAVFPDERLIAPLVQALWDSNPDLRSGGAIALGQIRGERAKGALRARLAEETDEHVRSIISGQL